jgi:AcrR family transcriptional regulator
MPTDETRKKSRRGKVTRDRIIETAEILIARNGPDGFQLQNVTELLGITPPAIYNHFKDREDLVSQIAEKGARLLAETMRRDSGEDIVTSLRRNARRYVAFLAENPAHARIILWDMARRGTTGWHGLARSNLETRDRMRSAFDIASEQGTIRKIRMESYLAFLYIGSAAVTVWSDYEEEHDGEASPPAQMPQMTADEINQLQDEAEDLVVWMLSPEHRRDHEPTSGPTSEPTKK